MCRYHSLGAMSTSKLISSDFAPISPHTELLFSDIALFLQVFPLHANVFHCFFIDFFFTNGCSYCTIHRSYLLLLYLGSVGLVFLCILCLPMDFTPAFSIVFLTEDVFFSYSSLIAVPIASLSAVKLIFTGALVNIPVIAGLSIPVHPLKSTSVKLVIRFEHIGCAC